MEAVIAPTWSDQREITRRGVLWVGLRCDVRCKFCYDERVAPQEKAWLPPEAARSALDKFRTFYRNEFVDFMGGEPTLHPQMVDIVAHAASVGLRPTVITHGMRLADRDLALRYRDAGIHDFLVSVHGIGDSVASIHGRGSDNFARQVAGLENLRSLGIPFRFNVTVIRDNLNQLEAIAGLATELGARVVNFLTFNPYFEWHDDPAIEFQPKHSEAAPPLMRAIDRCASSDVEANVRYLPLCQLPGYESHVYTGHQLPYDPHEWDYNSWYDTGERGPADPVWYRRAALTQQQRHDYRHPPPCDGCAVRSICDGFHAQYLVRWGDSEAHPFRGPPVDDPTHFIGAQRKLAYAHVPPKTMPAPRDHGVVVRIGTDGRAGIRRRSPQR